MHKFDTHMCIKSMVDLDVFKRTQSTFNNI